MERPPESQFYDTDVDGYVAVIILDGWVDEKAISRIIDNRLKRFNKTSSIV